MKLTPSHQDKLRTIRSHVAKGLSLSALLTFGTALSAAAVPPRTTGTPPAPKNADTVRAEPAPLMGKIVAPKAEERQTPPQGAPVIAGIVAMPEAELEVSSTDSQIHTVKQGETLIQIAKLYYGNGSVPYVRVILKANAEKIKDPRQIKVGTKLIIPALKKDGE